jgi:tetratricopeptide (TPR) repeat protein
LEESVFYIPLFNRLSSFTIVSGAGCDSTISKSGTIKNSEMSAGLSVALASTSPAWRRVFELQNIGDYSHAFEELSRIAHTTDEESLLADICGVKLRICLEAVRGVHPDGDCASELQKVISRAENSNIYPIAIEGNILLHDCFPDLSDQALSALSGYEPYMDQSTRRRWLHRRGISHMRSGNIQEAADLWTGLIDAAGDSETDQDDSLAVLLLDYGRVSSQLGKYADAVELYNQALCVSRTPVNQAASLVRLSNALERISRPAQADKRRIEYFHMIGKDYPTRCALCSMNFGKEPKFLLPCCKTVAHSECLRIIVSDHQEDETDCPFCATHFVISDIADPTSISARKYQRHKRNNDGKEFTEEKLDLDPSKSSE